MRPIFLTTKNSHPLLDEEQVKQLILPLSQFQGRKFGWVKEDLRIKSSNWLTRLIWTCAAKHFDWTRKLFYGVDLENSRRNLHEIVRNVDQGSDLHKLCQGVIAKFNVVAPRHQVTEGSTDFNVRVNNKRVYWSEDRVKQKLMAIIQLQGKKEGWVKADLEVSSSNGLTRLIWTSVAKHLNFIRELFYGVNLKQSKALLCQIALQVDKGSPLQKLCEEAIAKFNSIAPNHQAIIQPFSFDLVRKINIKPGCMQSSPARHHVGATFTNEGFISAELTHLQIATLIQVLPSEKFESFIADHFASDIPIDKKEAEKRAEKILRIWFHYARK